MFFMRNIAYVIGTTADREKSISLNTVALTLSAGKKVLNQDLWEALDSSRLANVSLEYVKGHNGDPDNERVDDIAVSF